MTMLLRGKRALVVGLMNKHSLAANVTQALLSHGAQVVVSSKSPLTESQRKACGFHAPSSSMSATDESDTAIIAPSLHFRECDVEDDTSIEALISECGAIFGGQLDILVHSIAFAPRETFAGPGGILATSKSAWQQAMDVSTYSLIALTRTAYPLLSSGADGSLARDRSILALSYAGANKVIPNYNVMGLAKAALEATSRQLAHELGPEGIRVNCLSPGPMNTVSARGIPGISRMRKYSEEHSPLRRNATGFEIGNTAAFLASDMASAITGQIIYASRKQKKCFVINVMECKTGSDE
uniref:Enoyl-[acyl-carrier-protein] reductase [NADH] n=1 Tax=Globisporangium ultimum (strain ATCC 200006 / CBS 805.95 / DAOM BR144) TaxID=431595 RepID=K3WLP9_GLOUD